MAAGCICFSVGNAHLPPKGKLRDCKHGMRDLCLKAVEMERKGGPLHVRIASSFANVNKAKKPLPTGRTGKPLIWSRLIIADDHLLLADLGVSMLSQAHRDPQLAHAPPCRCARSGHCHFARASMPSVMAEVCTLYYVILIV